jgi:hypothetical protein
MPAGFWAVRLTEKVLLALPSPQGGHDRGRVFADLACAAHPICWIEKAHVAELTGLLPEGPAVTS